MDFYFLQSVQVNFTIGDFLFFKKTPYLHTDNYWRNGFYQIPKNYNFDKGGKVIITRSYTMVEKD